MESEDSIEHNIKYGEVPRHIFLKEQVLKQYNKLLEDASVQKISLEMLDAGLTVFLKGIHENGSDYYPDSFQQIKSASGYSESGMRKAFHRSKDLITATKGILVILFDKYLDANWFGGSYHDAIRFVLDFCALNMPLIREKDNRKRLEFVVKACNPEFWSIILGPFYDLAGKKIPGWKDLTIKQRDAFHKMFATDLYNQIDAWSEFGFDPRFTSLYTGIAYHLYEEKVSDSYNVATLLTLIDERKAKYRITQ